ncbi:MAG: penicillin-binding protein A [Oscillospiraceae bacterium]|nr:penicillin-binding protein A [Oscillospiraceae bacterium]
MFEDSNFKSTLTRRLAVLVLFMAVCIGLYTYILYDTQIVHGEEYLQQSVRTITISEPVETSRGILTDRNGKVLVSNRLSYALTFDSDLLGEGQDLNQEIWKLMEICTENGIAWTDNLPITAQRPLVYYTGEELSSSQRNRLEQFLKRHELSTKVLTEEDPMPDISAYELFKYLRELYEIDPTWSDEQARCVMAARYELEYRSLTGYTSYVFAEDIPVTLITELKDGKFSCVTVETSSTREYNTTYAAHVLGYTGRMNDAQWETYKDNPAYAYEDIVGKTGVEAAFEEYLHGTDGVRIITTNDEGKITSELYSVDPQPGDTVRLTLDITLQKAADNALAETITKMTNEDGIARGAGAAVVQVGTGDVLALASYPTYNLATFNQDYATIVADERNPLNNRATSGLYPPGSTFKPCTAVAAIESGTITTATRIRDEGIYTYYSHPQPRCWIYPSRHGNIDVAEAIKVSCNYFFYEVGRLMGINVLNDYAMQFGLGKPTGIEIGDAAGNLSSPEYCQEKELTWTDGQTITAAIGQSYTLCTPLQLANYIATLVGGGDHYDCHLLKSVSTYDNSEVVYAYNAEPTNTVAMAPETLAAVKQGMGDLVTSGSVSSYFADCVVTAGAKTGTAQLGSNIKNNGIFVCFAPFDEPEIAVAIVIEKGGSGAALASTAVEILNAYFSPEEIGTAVIGENTLLP